MIREDTLKSIFKDDYLFETVQNQVVIRESDSKSKVKQLNVLNQPYFLSINTKIVKDFSKFFHSSVLTKDCDGVVVFEYDNKKYVYIVELKSTYNSVEIFKASKQIISTYIKLNALLGLVTPFEKDNYIFLGFIAAKNPDIAKISGMSKFQDKEDVRFALKLHSEKYVDIKFNKTEAALLPLNNRCCFNVLRINFLGTDLDTVNLDSMEFI